MIMSVELNHIIVPATEKHASAGFLAGILGLPLEPEVGPFVPLALSNGVTIDFMNAAGFRKHHCAFLVSEEEFDQAFARIRQAGIDYWADPDHHRPSEINHLFGGRGVYFPDPDGHNMELLTRSFE
jgi:catechol 2,3-dioxygenase-like lactoylglutathione lyase family enzyme